MPESPALPSNAFMKLIELIEEHQPIIDQVLSRPCTVFSNRLRFVAPSSSCCPAEIASPLVTVREDEEVVFAAAEPDTSGATVCCQPSASAIMALVNGRRDRPLKRRWTGVRASSPPPAKMLLSRRRSTEMLLSQMSLPAIEERPGN